MTHFHNGLSSRIIRRIYRFLRDRRGNIAALTALLLVPLVTIMGTATQAGSWFLMQRAMQNAADSAVIAAATNGGNGGTDYATEAKSVTASYGFTNGSNNVTVTVPAPAKYTAVTSCASSTCYDVKITAVAPLYLLQLVGYTGNAAITGGRGQTITAGALATTVATNAPFCLTVLGSGGITSDGDPNSTLACNIQSNGDATCHGHSLTTGYSDTAGSSTSNCGSGQHTGLATITDPYASLASDIPPLGTNGTTCASGYYPEGYVNPTKGGSSWPTSNNLIASFTMANAVQIYCGDVEVSGGGTVTISPPGGSSGVIVIENGALDVKAGTTLQASNVTIIFDSPSGTSDQYTATGCTGKKCSLQVTDNGPIGSGDLALSSPTSGTWSGMAMYEDPSLPEQSLDYAGNSPGWSITGIIDLSKTDFEVDGDVGASSAGNACFALVVDSLTIKGTGNLFTESTQCVLQGASLPVNVAGVVGKLVY